jgi:hypothetical protein
MGLCSPVRYVSAGGSGRAHGRLRGISRLEVLFEALREEAPLFLDDLVDALPGDPEVLREAGLAAHLQGPVFEHVADGCSQPFRSLGVAFRHGCVSECLDIA